MTEKDVAQKQAPPPKPDNQATTQEKKGFREGLPDWIRQLPQFRFPSNPNPSYQLIDRDELREQLKDADPKAVQRIEEDLDFLEHELMRLFRQRDHEAALQQNRYRIYQIVFMALATLATLIGSLQALALGASPDFVPIFAFGETVIALAATYLATISGREPPLPLWLSNRRRAEQMRREYFRFLTNMPPYDLLEGYERRTMLSRRAADINRGVHPDTDRSS